VDGAPVESAESFNWQGIGARGVGAEDNKGFGIAIDPHSRIHPRFQLAATFADYLFSEEDEVFLSTTASTDRQKRNRAFAAEFLVPIDAIRAKLGRRNVVDANDISEICDEFGVSPAIPKYQIENQARDLTLRA
jgi:Zn-dependent peptidase ImmA (M78 family)